MKKLLLILVTTVCFSGFAYGKDVEVGGKYIAAHNVGYYKKTNKIYSLNRQYDDFLPIGTEIKVTAVGRKAIKFSIGAEVYTFVYQAKYTNLAIDELFQRFFELADNYIALENKVDDTEVIDSIRKRRVKFGMTKEQVILTIGYPRVKGTVVKNSDKWKYYKIGNEFFEIEFADGVVVAKPFDGDVVERNDLVECGFGDVKGCNYVGYYAFQSRMMGEIKVPYTIKKLSAKDGATHVVFGNKSQVDYDVRIKTSSTSSSYSVPLNGIIGTGEGYAFDCRTRKETDNVNLYGYLPKPLIVHNDLKDSLDSCTFVRDYSYEKAYVEPFFWLKQQIAKIAKADKDITHILILKEDIVNNKRRKMKRVEAAGYNCSFEFPY